MLNRKIFFIVLLLSFAFAKAFSQPVPVNRETANDSALSEHLNQTNDYLQQATEQYNAFKNGPAFDLLLKYGDLKEKEAAKHKEDEIKQLESKFKTDYSRRQQELKDTQQTVDSLKKEYDSLEQEKQKLTRNTILFFVILISLLIVVLVSRMQLAKKAQTLADISSVQLNRTLKLADIPGSVSKMNVDLKYSFQSVTNLSSRLVDTVPQLKSIAINQKKNTDTFQKLEDPLQIVKSVAEQAVASLNSIEKTISEIAEEKVITNLNKLISEVFDISFHWIRSFDESFDCTKVKDLEKILPEIIIMPIAIRTALFHFFNNAFYSVYEKKKSEGKSYEPKISVTTRKLHRFVQVRIKDNGSGIEENILSKI
ncbi:MAG: hypothetical protein ABI855_10295, partial [Bacteroidota bacterium]